MRDYKPSSKKGYSRDRDTRQLTMHNAVCDECGKKCKVPFRPTGDKPVYCSDCFERQSGGRSGRRDPRKHDYEERRMYTATCDECGNECKVPFKPTGDKPVYCSDCFERQSGRRSGRRDPREHDYKERRMYTATCDECGNECEVPFKPTSGKPVFCDDCFKGTSKKRSDKGVDSKQLQEQIDVISSKLDSIIQTMESLVVVKKEPKKKSSAKKTVSKIKKATAKKGKLKAKKPTEKKAKKTVKKKTKAKKSTSKEK